jgi:hypothetical protein
VDTIQVLENHLTTYGWASQRLEDGSLLTGFGDEGTRAYAITIVAGDQMVTLTIAFELDDLFVDQKTLWAFLSLNGILPWAKLAVDAEHSLLLAVDCPVEALSYPVFSLALDLLSSTAQLLVERFKGVIK